MLCATYIYRTTPAVDVRCPSARQQYGKTLKLAQERSEDTDRDHCMLQALAGRTLFRVVVTTLLAESLPGWEKPTSDCMGRRPVLKCCPGAGVRDCWVEAGAGLCDTCCHVVWPVVSNNVQASGLGVRSTRLAEA